MFSLHVLMMLAALYGLLVGLVEAWTRSRVFESLDFMEAKFEEAFTRENKFEIKLYGPMDPGRSFGHWEPFVKNPSYLDGKFYCPLLNLTIAAVTYSDCSKPFIFAHCNDTTERTFHNLIATFGRVPLNLRSNLDAVLLPRLSPQYPVLPKKNPMGHPIAQSSFQEGHSLVLLTDNLSLTGATGHAIAAMTDGWQSGESGKRIWDSAWQDSCVIDATSQAMIAPNIINLSELNNQVKATALVNYYQKNFGPLDANFICMRTQVKVIEDIYGSKLNFSESSCQNKVRIPYFASNKTVFIDNVFKFDREYLKVVTDTHSPVLSPWPLSTLPKLCYDKALANQDFPGGISAPRCSLKDMQAHNVTYSDCPSSPWTICYCSSSATEMSVLEVANEIGRLPATLRSRLRHIIHAKGVGGGGMVTNHDVLLKGNLTNQAKLFIHEAAHAVDFYNATRLSDISGWWDAIEDDSCNPSDYSQNNEVELYAEMAALWITERNTGLATKAGYDLKNGCLKRKWEFVGRSLQGMDVVGKDVVCDRKVKDEIGGYEVVEFEVDTGKVKGGKSTKVKSKVVGGTPEFVREEPVHKVEMENLKHIG